MTSGLFLRLLQMCLPIYEIGNDGLTTATTFRDEINGQHIVRR